MGMWKTLRVSHIPTPPTTTTGKYPTRRYTNIPLGTKDRSGQIAVQKMEDIPAAAAAATVVETLHGNSLIVRNRRAFHLVSKDLGVTITGTRAHYVLCQTDR